MPRLALFASVDGSGVEILRNYSEAPELGTNKLLTGPLKPSMGTI